MYGPDSYLYETNMTLLATLSDEELADADLVAQLTPGTTALAEVSSWFASALSRGLTTLADWFAPVGEPAEAVNSYWLHPPLY